MIKLGEYNILKVVKIVDFGVYLDGGEYWGEILLPKETAPAECKEGDELKVFIYFDSEDRVIATMTIPKAVVGDFALMKVVGTSRVGAFLDWGLRKDLLVPFREQREEMRFRKLDEAIRGRQRGYQEAAAAKLPPYTPTKMNKRRFGLFRR